MRLKELQRAFQARVLSFTEGIESEFDIRPADDLGPRLDAYVGGYRTRLVEALGASYPALQKTMGPEHFAEYMYDYIDARPSRHYSVREYGADLAAWLTASEIDERAEIFAELARFEWTLAYVFDAPDDEPLNMSALAAVAPGAWPGLSFTLRRCVRRFQTASNVVQWWRAASNLAEEPSELQRATPCEWLLWRRGVSTYFRSLDEMEASALDAVAAGATFSDLCEGMTAHADESETALRAATLLRGWIAEDLISADQTLPESI
jgi:Putative DNA-binding domain